MASVLNLTDFARLAADRSRLAVLGCVAVRSRTAAEVATATALAPRDAVRILGKLVSGGLIRVCDGMYELNENGLRALAATLTTSEPADASILGGLDEDAAEVAAHFFRGRRLVEIPAAEGRRRSVLRVLLNEFEPGRCYTEGEVRCILRRFHPDDAALRRYLVDERMLAREDSSRTYWRTSGPPPRG
jgi:hypothetical protein